MKIKAVDFINNHSEDGTLDLIGVAKKLYPNLKLTSDNVIFIGDKFIFQSDNIENVELVLYGLIVANQNEKESIESLNNRWAKSREEAKNTGIQIGIRLGVENSEEFWNKWDELILGDDFPSEDEVMNECIDIIFNIKQ